MAFNNSNYGNFNNGNNANGNEEPKKKTNYPITSLYGADGIMSIRTWTSDRGGVYCILSIKTGVKDPNGGIMYEQKMPTELPRVMLNKEKLCTLLEYLKMTPVAELNGTLDCGKQSSIQLVGDGGGDVKITITNSVGTRTISFKSDTIGNKNINSSMELLVDFLEIAFAYTKLSKLDMEEFGAAVNSTTESATNDDAPF